MQLTYNNRPLLATGCYEDYEAGLTRMGRQLVTEMNRVGLVVVMSHFDHPRQLRMVAQGLTQQVRQGAASAK